MTEVGEFKTRLAKVSQFLEERYDPLVNDLKLLKEEQTRVADEVRQLLAGQRESRLEGLLTSRSNDRPRVRQGRYLGMDRLDLGIMRSVSKAIIDNPKNLAAKQIEAVQEWYERVNGEMRALDSATTGAGDELTATLLGTELWMDVNLLTAVASLFRSIPMPSNPFEIPLQLGDVNWYPGTSNVAGPSTDLTTAKRVMTAFELFAMVPWALDLDEDSVIAVLPEVRSTLVRNAAEVWDDVILNGDTTLTNNINADGATISANDAGKAQWLIGFDGLRHIPLVDNTSQGNDHNAAPSDDMFNEVRAKLGKYGVRPVEMAHIMDVNTYIRAQAVSTFRTIDKLGPLATLLTGQLGSVEGIPVIVSEWMRLADTDGKVTDAGNGTDTGSLLTVNRSQFWRGFKRDLTIETERDIQKRQTVMVASMRLAFLGRNAVASDTSVALQFDITGVS